MTWFICCCGRKSSEVDDEDKVEEIYQVKDNKQNFNNNDLTKDNPIRTSTIEELKSKLGTKDPGDVESEAMIPEKQRPHGLPQPHLSEDGLIMPRKPTNPVLDNTERQNLHKELLFNQKIGKNVLNQKSELRRALEKRKDNCAKKEMESNIAAKTPELINVIANRAKRLEEVNTTIQNEDDKGLSKEFLQARAKLKARADSK